MGGKWNKINKILLWKIKIKLQIKTKRNEWILGAKRYQFAIKRGFGCMRFSIREKERERVSERCRESGSKRVL